MSAFINLLRSEIARLESQLTHARALLESYDGTEPREFRPAKAANGASRPIPFQSMGADSKEQKVRAAIRDLLRERGLVHRKEILEHIKGLGLMGHERNPLKSLGVYMNRIRVELSPEGAGMWRLRDHEKGEGA
jgi:hypothetical protein